MSILQALMCRSEADLDSPFAKYLCLALGLLFLGKQDLVEATLEVRRPRKCGIEWASFRMAISEDDCFSIRG